ncbi:MAG: class II aldolase/adducin family protein [Thermoanaerobaculia bacterium]|nr:class II aldolase/adducin family protein [Thermoanaerobaculia bacterium]
MSDRFEHPREEVCAHARAMWEAGLVVGSAGNVSRRAGPDHIAITPTSLAYDLMTPDDVTIIEIATGKAVDSSRAASYELPMHLVVYRRRADVAAIVHTHAPFVTTLSILRKPLPPVIDEMMLYFGGRIEVTDYAFTGTEAVGENVVKALGDRTGVIIANHGNVCVGRDLKQALHVAVVMESAARAYVQALAIGEPIALPDDAIAAGRRLFDSRKS